MTDICKSYYIFIPLKRTKEFGAFLVMEKGHLSNLCVLYIFASLKPDSMSGLNEQLHLDFHLTSVEDACSNRADFDIYEAAVIESDVVTPATLDLIKEIRRQNHRIPILIYVHSLNKCHELQVIEQGANHYLLKEDSNLTLFTYLEMIRVIIREFNSESAIHRLTETTEFNSLTHELTISSQTWKLRSTEAFLLHNLSNNKGHILSKERLIYLLWGKARLNKEPELKKYICYLRAKLKNDPGLRLEFKHDGYVLYSTTEGMAFQRDCQY